MDKIAKLLLLAPMFAAVAIILGGCSSEETSPGENATSIVIRDVTGIAWSAPWMKCGDEPSNGPNNHAEMAACELRLFKEESPIEAGYVQLPPNANPQYSLVAELFPTLNNGAPSGISWSITIGDEEVSAPSLSYGGYIVTAMILEKHLDQPGEIYIHFSADGYPHIQDKSLRLLRPGENPGSINHRR